MQNPEICDCKTHLQILGKHQYQTSNRSKTIKLRSVSDTTRHIKKRLKNLKKKFLIGGSYMKLWLDRLRKNKHGEETCIQCEQCEKEILTPYPGNTWNYINISMLKSLIYEKPKFQGRHSLMNNKTYKILIVLYLVNKLCLLWNIFLQMNPMGWGLKSWTFPYNGKEYKTNLTQAFPNNRHSKNVSPNALWDLCESNTKTIRKI